ncbi:MAG: SIMPL domain-containing protein [Bryobacteraceae bacterium]|jgi:uncharacterized protein
MTRFVFSLFLVIPALAQTTPASVQAQGSATISVQPDQAQLTVSIATSGTTAQEAGQQNATLTATVLAALQKLIGTNGTIATSSYTISPRYSNGTATQAPTIVGYSATITEQLTLNDLTLIGQAIDNANQAGATSVGNLTLGLQNPEPVLETALTAAAKQALTHAGAIASGLGGKTGPVISAQQAATYAPTATLLVGAPGSSAATAVQPGPVSVSATVTVTVQLQ